MDEREVYIRIASPEDAPELLKVYAPYVVKTAVSFEYCVPETEEFQERVRKTLSAYPYLAAIMDGELVGYAYMNEYKARAAYSHSAETTIYIREDVRKTGVGKLLYQALEGIARAQNITNLYACIAYPETEDEYLTKNSAQFHSHMGFAPVGVFRNCGCKFGRWYSIVWTEKMIAGHSCPPLPMIPFPKLSPEILTALGVRL